jgi:phospholipid/cholesterol/gamma-HCH transport system permease protein
MAERAEIGFSRPEEGTLVLNLSGSWRSSDPLPPPDSFQNQLYTESMTRRVSFTSDGLTVWDSAFMTFLLKVKDLCIDNDIELDLDGLPEGAGRLLQLASAVPERKGARKEVVRVPFLEKVGTSAMEAGESTVKTITFLGEATRAFWAMFRGKAQFVRSDLVLYIEECGAKALPIVSLISFLVGLIIGFVGAVQLEMFGAQIYMANLVGVAMVRSLAAIMTGIIMAGRTGASYAAQLGTMQVNEEIDALRTLGISPMEFLVLPRMLALMIMMPLLVLYADLLGILGGALVGTTIFGITPMEYFQQTKIAIPLKHVWIGVFQGWVFGILVAIAGCLRGMQCGRSAWEVGAATTSAVVTAIVWIISSCAIMTVIFQQLGL